MSVRNEPQAIVPWIVITECVSTTLTTGMIREIPPGADSLDKTKKC